MNAYNLVITHKMNGHDPETSVMSFSDARSAMKSMNGILGDYLWDTVEKMTKERKLFYFADKVKYVVYTADNNFLASLQVVKNEIAEPVPEKPQMKKYEVHYSFYLSDSVYIEAENERKAKDKAEELLNTGVIGDIKYMEVGERKVWID